MKVNTFVAVFVAFVTVTNAAKKVLMCYYQSWTSLSANELKGADNCTHMIYSFITTTADGRLEVDNEVFLQKFLTLKKSNPKMKLMVATGGWNHGTKSFIDVARDSNKRKKYAKNVKKFLKKYNLHGFDLDWEFPQQGDKANFIELIKDLKATLSKSKKILTAAVGATREHIANSYNVAEMSEHLDYINVMTYDLNDRENEFNAPLNLVKKSIDGWLQEGAKPGKLVLGTAFYGKSNGQPVDYLSICKKIKLDGYKREFNETNGVPIIEKNGERINYDDKQSLKLKVGIINGLNLGGAMVWSIEKDDKTNECDGGEFPLLNALKEGLNEKHSSLSNVPKPKRKPHRPIKPTKS